MTLRLPPSGGEIVKELPRLGMGMWMIVEMRRRRLLILAAETAAAVDGGGGGGGYWSGP